MMTPAYKETMLIHVDEDHHPRPQGNPQDMSIKKILAIDQGEYPGGAEMFFSELLTRLDHGYEIHLLCGAYKKYQDRYKGSSVKIHELDMPKLKPIGIRTYKKYRETQ